MWRVRQSVAIARHAYPFPYVTGRQATPPPSSCPKGGAKLQMKLTFFCDIITVADRTLQKNGGCGRRQWQWRTGCGYYVDVRVGVHDVCVCVGVSMGCGRMRKHGCGCERWCGNASNEVKNWNQMFLHRGVCGLASFSKLENSVVE